MENVPGFGIDNRVVVLTVHLDFNQLAEQRLGIVEHAHHVRSATQGVRVLNLFGNHVLLDFQVHSIAHFLCGSHQARVRLHGKQTFVEVVGIPLHGNRVHRRNAAAQIGQIFGTAKGHASNGVHHSRTIHDSNSFLGAETVRGDSEFGHHVLRCTTFSLIKDIAFANQSPSQVRKRSQVATCAHGTFLRNQRQNVVLQKVHDDIQKRIAHTRESTSKRIQAHQHDSAGRFLVKIVSHAAAMETSQVHGQIVVMIRRHHLSARIAVTGRHAVNSTMFSKSLVQKSCARIDLLLELGARIQFHERFALGNGNHLLNGQFFRSDDDSFHFILLCIFCAANLEIIQ